MSKIYIVYQSWGICDDSSIIGAFLNKEKAEHYVEEHNEPRNIEMEQHTKCQKCRCDENNYEVEGQFNSQKICPKAVIQKDRNGLYCENDKSDFYSISTDSYWLNEVDILE